VVHQEVAAGKEYPGGFSLLRIFSGGYALNFFKTRSDLSRNWSERSRMEISGYWPQFSLGARVADRNSVAAHDFSGLEPPPEPPTTTTSTTTTTTTSAPSPPTSPAPGDPAGPTGPAPGAATPVVAAPQLAG
jgi:hypothetical protein